MFSIAFINPPKRKAKYSSHAFTLIEMSVVLVIIGVVAAGSLSIGQAFIDRTQYKTTDAQMEEIRESLLFFYRNNNRLPCPAPASLAIGNNALGREIIWNGSGDSCANDTTVPTGTTRIETATGSGIWVRTGALPTRDLRLPDAMMADQFDNRFTYAVIEDLTDDTTFNAAQAAIIINDENGSNIGTNIAFVVLSHGDDGKGSYRYRSGSQIACGSGTIDTENCDGDSTYSHAPYSDSAFGNFYDDRIIWMTQSTMRSEAIGLGAGNLASRFAGIITSTHNGDLGGIVGGNTLCQATFTGSRVLRASDFPFLTSSDFATLSASLPSSGAATPPSSAVWFLQPGTYVTNNTCEGFGSSSASRTAPTLYKDSTGKLIVTDASCNTSHRLACVYD